MTRHVLYVAHPLAPTEEETSRIGKITIHGQLANSSSIALRANIDRALRWLAWLRKSFPETTFIAPWIASVMSGEDNADPKQREAGLVDDCAAVERCDGIVLCGGRISSGMQREREHGRLFHQLPRGSDPNPFRVYDLTCPSNPDPPLTVGEMTMSLEELADVARSMWRR